MSLIRGGIASDCVGILQAYLPLQHVIARRECNIKPKLEIFATYEALVVNVSGEVDICR
jgi:hypothetical protein